MTPNIFHHLSLVIFRQEHYLIEHCVREVYSFTMFYGNISTLLDSSCSVIFLGKCRNLMVAFLLQNRQESLITLWPPLNGTYCKQIQRVDETKIRANQQA